MNKKELLIALASRKGNHINMKEFIDLLLSKCNDIVWSYSEAKGVSTFRDGLKIYIYNATAGKLVDYIIEIYDLDDDGDEKTLLEYNCFSEEDPLSSNIESLYYQAKKYAHDKLMDRIKESFD